jgi:hypothetical protein
MTFIADHPPYDGQEYDCQCARCGSSMHYERCDQCEDGFDGHDCGEDCCVCLYPEDNMTCDICDGRGGWYRCFASPEWCAANPLPGREKMERSTPEWFVVTPNQTVSE